jgi:methylmalonyl-CoA/ethylmalonyl-CoA epimerase
MTPHALAHGFHHVGVACLDLASEAEAFAALGYVSEGDPFEDSTQGVRGLFMGGQAPRVELLEPLVGTGDRVLAPWLAHGIKLYHLAYVVPKLVPAIDALRTRHAKLVVPPVPAVAFGGREIAFLMLPNRLLIEYISAE